MTSPKYNITWKTFVIPLVGLVAFFAYILIFNVDILEIISTIRHADPGLYSIAVIAALLDTVFFTLAWHSLLRFLHVNISLFRKFLFVWVGIFVDTIIPAESVSGEVSKIYLVNRDQVGSAGKATASIVVQRLIGMVINVATLAVGATLLALTTGSFGILFWLIIVLVGLTALFFSLILLLCLRQDWTMRILNALINFGERVTRGRWKLAKIREDALEAARTFHVAIKEYVRAPKTLISASFFSALSWIFSLAIFYLTFQAIGYHEISWSAILVTSSIFIAVKSIPIGIPFEVGLPEATLTTLFVFFGIPAGIAATATILSRLLTLWMRFFIGFFAQQWLGIKAMTTIPSDPEAFFRIQKTQISPNVSHKDDQDDT